jgi:hypothetical protein
VTFLVAARYFQDLTIVNDTLMNSILEVTENNLKALAHSSQDSSLPSPALQCAEISSLAEVKASSSSLKFRDSIPQDGQLSHQVSSSCEIEPQLQP